MFLGFDPISFLFMAPGLLLALWAQTRIQSAYHEGSSLKGCTRRGSGGGKGDWLRGAAEVPVPLPAAVVLFQFVNLPVEFDASARARRGLLATGLIRPEEEPVVARVLNAAAWTYVAATLTSILTLLDFLLHSGLLGGRDRED